METSKIVPMKEILKNEAHSVLESKTFPTSFIEDEIRNILSQSMSESSTKYTIENLVVNGNGEEMEVDLRIRSDLSSFIVDLKFRIFNSIPKDFILIIEKKVESTSPSLKKNFFKSTIAHLSGLTDHIEETILEQENREVKSMSIVNGELEVILK